MDRRTHRYSVDSNFHTKPSKFSTFAFAFIQAVTVNFLISGSKLKSLSITITEVLPAKWLDLPAAFLNILPKVWLKFPYLLVLYLPNAFARSISSRKTVNVNVNPCPFK